MLEQKYLKFINVTSILTFDVVHKSDKSVNCAARNSLKRLTVFAFMLTKDNENP